MRPAFVLVILCALGDLARAEDVSSSDDAALLQGVLDAVTTRDTLAFAALAPREVQLSFLWFDTPACAKLFSGEGVVLEPGNRAAFLQCLATLDPHIEQHGTPAKAYLAYEPGVALQITARNGALASIAALASDADPTAAPISTHALVANRIAGAGKVVPDAAVRAAIAAATDAVAFAALFVCVDPSGKLESSVTTRRSPGYDSYVRAAEAAVAQWKFKPFVAHGKPVRACGPTLFAYPQDRWQRTLPSPAPVAAGAPGADAPHDVSPTMLDANRTAGDKAIVPDDETKTAIAAAFKTSKGEAKLVGSFKVCVDVAGAVTKVELLKSTDFPRYDQKLAKTISETWRYRPFLLDGKPIAVCAGVTFIYAQH